MLRDQITATILLILLHGFPYLMWLAICGVAWALVVSQDVWLGLAFAFLGGVIAGGWNSRTRDDPEIPPLFAGLREIWADR